MRELLGNELREFLSEKKSLTDLCWLLGASVRKIALFALFYTVERAFLPKHMRCEYNQRSPFACIH
jgi:hypothetical protein